MERSPGSIPFVSIKTETPLFNKLSVFYASENGMALGIQIPVKYKPVSWILFYNAESRLGARLRQYFIRGSVMRKSSVQSDKSIPKVHRASSRHIHSSLMWLVNYFSPDFSQAIIMRHCPNQLTCINTYNSHSNLGGRYYYYLFCR